jgi:RNA polymerase sigma-70 factor (ECF subfamily)
MIPRARTTPANQRSEFERVALVHLNALYGTALRLTHNQRDAEDLVQDTLLSAYRSFEQFQPGSQCKAWLFKILTNTFINKYRRRILEYAVAQGMQRDGDTGMMSAGGVRTARDAEEMLDYALMGESIQRALAALPEEFRLAVVLCDVEEFSYREIADIMECPVGTVMSRLHRGRKLLQAALREHAVRAGIVSEKDRDVADADEDSGARVIPLRSAGRKQ